MGLRVIVIIVAVVIIVFAGVTFWILKYEGVAQSSNTFSIVSAVFTVVIGLLGIMFAYFQWRYPMHHGESVHLVTLSNPTHSESSPTTDIKEHGSQDSLKTIFVSFSSVDRNWAEWIVWQLEEAHYSTMLQSRDFREEPDFVHNIQKDIEDVEYVIIVLSPNYLKAFFTEPRWATAFFKGTMNEKSKPLLVHVHECKQMLTELVGPISYIDLVSQNELVAYDRLLSGVQRWNFKPTFTSGLTGRFQRSITLQPRFPGSLPPIWNVPHHRNPFFTDREDILEWLYETLAVGKSAALIQSHVINGLGGIGKTQTAIEYAYRYHDMNQAVLWAKADSREALVSDFVSMAGLLNLPEKDEQNQSKAVEAVKRWLKDHGDWLLIFDNADDLMMVREFLPLTGRGHVLLTTRAQSTGTMAESMEVDQLSLEESMLLLLRRAKILTTDATLDKASEGDRTIAREISLTMGGLPLALDQAGAYIEETNCGLSGFLDRYRARRIDLLKRRGHVFDHPESVATTWSLSFEKIELANPAAAELLRLCAFLYPDAIPEEIITEGASELGVVLQPVATDPYELDAAIEQLRKYSLVRRNPDTRLLTMHRLVQAVLKDGMDENTQRQWAERTVLVDHCAFPEVEFAMWHRCQRLLPHVQVCAALIEHWEMEFSQAAQLLNKAGYYLHERSQYAEAEPLLKKSLDIRKKVFGEEHPDVAQTLNNLAEVYYDQGKYAQAEPLYRNSLLIREKILGSEHPFVAQTLSQLAKLYRIQGKFAEMEPLLKRSLAISEKQLRPDHPDVAQILIQMGRFYREQSNYTEAEIHLNRSLAIREQTLGVEHPLVAQSLNHIAGLYIDMGKYIQAEPLLIRALAIREKTLGPRHRDVGYVLRILGRLYNLQGKYAQAELFYKRALEIWQQVLGPKHSNVAETLNGLAILYYNQGKYTQAESYFTQALMIFEQTLGPDHPDVAFCLNHFGRLRRAQGRHGEAESLLMRAKRISEQTRGLLDHPHLAQTLNNLAEVYCDQCKYLEAEELFHRSLTMREQTLGPGHPQVAQTLNNLAELYYLEEKFRQAETYYQRALSIREQVLGNHPHVAQTLNGLGHLYSAQGRYPEAEPLFSRAIAIYEQTLGPDHIELVAVLDNYKALLQRTKRKIDAAKLEARTNTIRAIHTQENA